jgi:hypothetical protein
MAISVSALRPTDIEKTSTSRRPPATAPGRFHPKAMSATISQIGREIRLRAFVFSHARIVTHRILESRIEPLLLRRLANSVTIADLHQVDRGRKGHQHRGRRRQGSRREEDGTHQRDPRNPLQHREGNA